MTEAAKAGTLLCRLGDIEDGEAKGFLLGEGVEQRDIFVVRDGARAFGYVNSCPHVGTPLDWTPDEFMSGDGGHIMCRTHGALFEIADGTCIAGPCIGDRLTPVALELDGEGRIILVGH